MGSSAPEDGQNYRPKHVELIEIISKPLLLHLVDCLFCCISDARSHEHKICPNVLTSVKIRQSYRLLHEDLNVLLCVAKHCSRKRKYCK